MLGVPKNKVILSPHDDRWTDEFRQAEQRFRELFGDEIIRIEHVGSTAIPGILAKPMLDIAILFRAITAPVFDRMQDLGYTYYGEVAPGKHLFLLREADGRSLQHVHCCAVDKPEPFHEQLRFRDFLRAHPAYAREYEQLKQQLASRYPDDRSRYTAGKQEFFEKIKVLAAAEHAQGRPAGSNDRS